MLRRGGAGGQRPDGLIPSVRFRVASPASAHPLQVAHKKSTGESTPRLLLQDSFTSLAGSGRSWIQSHGRVMRAGQSARSAALTLA